MLPCLAKAAWQPATLVALVPPHSVCVIVGCGVLAMACNGVACLQCRELTPLGHLRSFDYAYQSTQDIYAPDAKILLPGDSLSLQV